MKNQMKEVIADAFFALAQKKEIDKITVKDLVEACGISRQTFYYHFRDLLEVIEWQAQRLEEEIAAQSRQADSPESAARILAAFFVEHHRLLEKLRDSQKWDFVEQMILEGIQGILHRAVRESALDRPLSITASELEALVVFFSYGLTGLMFSHYRNAAPDVEKLTGQILVVFQRLVPMREETETPPSYLNETDGARTTYRT